MTEYRTDLTRDRTRRGYGLIAAAAVFVLLYLATDFVTPNLASSSLPLPNDPVGEARAWYADNQLAAVMMGVTQFLSVLGLAAFATRLPGVAGTPAQAEAAERARPWGLLAVSLMMLSCVLAWLLAALAPSVSVDTVSMLRTSNFIAGGTAHVLALGIFVWLASRMPGFGKPVRVLAWVAVVPAVLSLSSLLFFQGAAFILLGRLLCMIWTVSAAVSVTRGLARGRWA
jgi:hypothetical protein